MTDRLYHQDSYLAKTEARIVGREAREGRYRFVLDRTIFSPRGGGQPEDRGALNGIAVAELIDAGEEIIHVLDADIESDAVTMEIDFPRRYDHMQQHTAQHLLSGYLLRELGIGTLSFAIGEEHASIELSVAEMDEALLRQVETGCGRLIFAALPVTTFRADDAADVPLRKPPKKEGKIRVVAISDYDHSACGGTHLKNTAEIGLVKIVRTDRVRGHVRIYYLAGYRALRDYQKKDGLMAEISRLVTLPLEEIPVALGKTIAERDELSRQLRTCRRQALDAEIAELENSSDPLVVRRFESEVLDELKYFTVALMKRGRHVISYSPPLGYVQIGRGFGSVDMRKISAEVFSLLNGRGGGRDALIEGKAGDFSRLDELIALVNRLLQNQG